MSTQKSNLPRVLLTLVVLATLSLPLAAAGPPAPAGEGRTFALVINGDAAAKHRGNVALALEVLGRMGVGADRLYVLSGTPEAPQTGPAAHYLRPTWASVKGVTKDLAAAIDADDTLIVYTTGHGAWDGGVPVLLLDGETVSVRELIRWLLAIGFGWLIFVADQCYSGAFVRELERSQRDVVAISATDAAHEVRCIYFSRPFWRALERQEKAGRLVTAVASLRAAFATAVESLRAGSPGEGSHARFVTAGAAAADAVADATQDGGAAAPAG